jgi:hypothetical protein
MLGIVYSDFEPLADGLDRSDDEAWRTHLTSGPAAADVAWLESALTPPAP